MILPAWIEQLEVPSFSYKEVQFKMFCQTVKDKTCPPAENVNEAPEIQYDSLGEYSLIWDI